MLSPSEPLQVIEMEGLTFTDNVDPPDPEALLGVDHTEYLGGYTAENATAVSIVQVKYSPSRPQSSWTVSRLTADQRRPGSSVIRKLSTSFNTLYTARGEDGSGIRLCLVTNQPIAPKLSLALCEAQMRIGELPDQEAGKVLRLAGDTYIAALQARSNLSWERFAAMIRSWDLTTFENGTLIRAETQVLAAVDQLTSQGPGDLQRLIAFVQEHAVTYRKTRMGPLDVLEALGLRQIDFWPAPPRLDSPDDYLSTRDAQRVAQKLIEEDNRLLLLHGDAGVGKTSCLQLVARDYQDDVALVIYDCFGDGEGVAAGQERFPATTCFTQIANELDAVLKTGVRATTRLSYVHLMEQFRTAVHRAAEIAADSGKRLAIAFDAVDNAVEAAEGVPPEKHTLFVPSVLRTPWPENCTVLLTARTENIPALAVPDTLVSLGLSGFTESESIECLSRILGDVSNTLLQRIIESTGGTPRLLTDLARALVRESPNDPLEFVETYARDTAVESYGVECRRRLTSSADIRLVATLREATQLVSVETLSRILARPVAEVRTTLEQLSFGIRIHNDGRVGWRNEDFLSFAREFSVAEKGWARERLADFCRAEFELDRYARTNYSRHTFIAGRPQELLDWWLDDDRLVVRREQARPHEEDVLGDVRYCLLAAGMTRSGAAVLRLLSVAADLIQGRDAFLEVLAEHADVASAEGFLDPLLEVLRNEEAGDVGLRYLKVAGALSRNGADPRIRTLACKGVHLLRQRGPERGEGLSRVAVGILAGIASETRGIGTALQELARWTPPAHAEFARVVAKASATREADIVDEINEAGLDTDLRTFALLGYLSVLRESRASNGATRNAVETVVSAIGAGELDTCNYQRPLGKAVQELLAAGRVAEATKLAELWEPPAPGGAWDGTVIDFVTCRAVHKLLGITKRAPDEEKGEPAPGKELDGRLKARIDAIRPALECRARAWISREIADLGKEIDTCLEVWRNQRRRHRGLGDFQVVAWLVEAMIATSQPVEVIRDMLEKAQTKISPTAWPYASLATVFARDGNYWRLAEETVLRALQVVRPPDSSSRDAADLLLELYPITQEFDADLAADLFANARLLTGDLDWAASERGYALLAVCRRAVQGDSGSADQVRLLAEVLEYLHRVEVEERQINLGEALELLVQVDPPSAFLKAADWERRAVFDARKAAVSLGDGLLQMNHAPELVWPLAELTSDTSGKMLLRAAIEQMEHSQSRDEAVSAYTARVLWPWNDVGCVTAIDELKTWAIPLGLGSHEGVQVAVRFGEWLRSITDVEPEEESPWSRSSPSSSLDPLPESAEEALQALESFAPRDLRRISADEIIEVVERLSASLPYSEMSRLLGVVETWSNDRWPIETFSAVAVVSARAGTVTACAAVSETLGNLLTPRALRWLPNRYDPGAWETLRSAWPNSDVELFAVLTEKLGQALSQLPERALHQWVVRLSELLPARIVSGSADSLLEATWARIPDKKRLSSASSSPTETISGLLLKFITDLLGHPRQDTRWRAVYTLVGMIHGSPNEVVRFLVGELLTKEHARWLTRREWLYFVLNHVALVRPEFLVAHISNIAQHALDQSLPHAKLRYHAKQIVTLTEKAFPGSVDPATLERLRPVNEPLSFIRRDDLGSGGIPYPEPRWPSRPGKVFRFNSMDTMPYWFSPMARCFGMHRCHIAERAYRWIVDEWGLTDEACTSDRQEDPHTYDWRETMNDHGDAPAVETLRTYAERHGMFLAAGELIDAEPVVWEEGWSRSHWEDRMRYARSADPCLPSRLLGLPPLSPESYGHFETPVEEWQANRDPTRYRRLLLADADTPDWFVIAGDWAGTFLDRDFFVSISSSLVSAQTACSLADLLRSSDRYSLPEIKVSYAGVLHELQTDTEVSLREADTGNDERVDEGPLFQLRPLAIQWEQELPFHGFDPKWPAGSRRLNFLAPEPVESLGLVRDPLGSSWRDVSGRVAARLEAWHERARYGEHGTGARGNRLLLRCDAVTRLREHTACDVIVKVTISRNKSANHRTSDDAYELGRSEIFLLSDFE
ncbi:hypothetical protein [Candidatus Palauibacter sp.]|uniref:hypothetical protein n=1 Tax=Candidatus Palauibacter sp. TaxID=3101350 RepID=UPI003B52C26D